MRDRNLLYFIKIKCSIDEQTLTDLEQYEDNNNDRIINDRI